MEYQFESLGPALSTIVLLFLIAFVLMGLAVIVVIAALPGRIARSRSHPQAEAINICGWVGLPSGILWAIALVWAYTRQTNAAVNTSESAELIRKLAIQVEALEKSIHSIEANGLRSEA